MTSMRRSPVPTLTSASVDLLDRSSASLFQASRCGDAAERYVEAHLGALRAAAAVVAARNVPGRRSRPRSVWQVLTEVAPELTEWAAFFAASGQRRAALERGAPMHGAREADDLLRQAEVFLGIVADLLGIPRRDAVSAYIAPVGIGTGGGGRG